jgi:hypothetical protein
MKKLHPANPSLDAPFIVVRDVVVQILLLLLPMASLRGARRASHRVALVHGRVLCAVDLGRGRRWDRHWREGRLDPRQLDLAHAGDVAAGGAVHEIFGGEAVFEGDACARWACFDVDVLPDALDCCCQ